MTHAKFFRTDFVSVLYRLPVGSAAASEFLREFFGVSSGVLRELPKVSERIPEGFPKKTIQKHEAGATTSGVSKARFQSKWIISGKINFT
jgi:hypothetical protein